MDNKEFKYIFGPVFSWRLGVSVGIDPISQKDKVCNFDCLYCQLGETFQKTNTRKIFVPTQDIIEEIKLFPAKDFDYYTFSSRGEPTLALNLGEIIREIKKIKKEKVAVITNSSLINDPDVRRDLSFADFVLLKVDAFDQESFEKINRTYGDVKLADVIDGIKEFRKTYRGKLGLQIMFFKENEEHAKEISDLAKTVKPDQIQINTPLRENSYKPLHANSLDKICGYFKGLPIISVYDKDKKEVMPISDEKTSLRHGRNKKFDETI